jgi:hypothetical protein
MKVTKPFSRKLYNKYNEIGIQVLMQWLWHENFENVRRNPNAYGIDVYAEKNGIKYSFDAEVKPEWLPGEDFPYPVANILWRKSEYPEFKQPKRFYIALISLDSCKVICIRGDEMTEKRLVYRKNKYMEREKVYEIPLDVAKKYERKMDKLLLLEIKVTVPTVSTKIDMSLVTLVTNPPNNGDSVPSL